MPPDEWFAILAKQRFSCHVAPSPSASWQPPDPRAYTRELEPTEVPVIDPRKRYELPQLIGWLLIDRRLTTRPNV